MKKIFISIAVVFSMITLNSQTTIFFDSFTNINNWNNVDLTGSNPVAGIWKHVPISTTVTNPYVWFQSYAINSAQTDYLNDGLAENGALTMKNPLNCSTFPKVYLDFESTFDYPTGGATTPNNLGRGYVEVSNNGIVWNIVATLSQSEGILRRLDISQWAGGQASVQVRFRYQSNFSGYWLLDKVKVYNPAARNVGVAGITDATERTLGGFQMVSYVLVNYGSDTIFSSEVEFKTAQTAAPEVIAVPDTLLPLGVKLITSGLAWVTTQGIYNTNVKLTKLNGTANNSPAATLNNASKFAIVYGPSASGRVPLFEVFTSSTCPPCKPGNEILHAVIDPKPAVEYNVLKFQQDFPGTGDPYATTETVNRRGLYAVNSIPRMMIDGGWNQNAGSFNESVYQTSIGKKSLFNMTGDYFFDKSKKEIVINVNITPLSNLFTNEFRIQHAVVEKKTVKNVKTNGEVMFEEVVKKMLPNENGTLLETISPNLMNANQTATQTLTYKINGNYRLPANGQSVNRINHNTENSIEDSSNLYVVSWIESRNAKLVLQSLKLKPKSTTSPTASNDSFHAKVGSVITGTATGKKILGKFKLIKDSTYVWNVPSIGGVQLPSNWSFVDLCDNNLCHEPPITTKEFTAEADSNRNFLEVNIGHNKNPGYGFVNVELWRKGDKTGTVKTYKFSLLATASASIGVISQVNDKTLHYFDNNIFLDKEFRNGTLEVFDIAGKMVMNSRISSDVVEFNTIPGNYIARVTLKGEVLKTLKFSTSK
jgi:hypothetical protein